MSTPTRSCAFYAEAHDDAVLRRHHLLRRRRELARTRAPWRARVACALALVAASVESAALATLAAEIEGVR